MAYSTTNLYPEDLYGTNPANLIKNEPQTLQAPGPKDYYFIIPKAAPFFVDSLKVVNAATQQPYVEGDDYQVGHLFVEAMDSTGRPIAGSIRFMRPTITGQVLLTYQTLGGNWGFSDTDILRELSNKLVNPLIRSWGDIAPLPYSFPPLPHDQRIDTLIGSEQINDTLNKIADILEATAEGTSQSHITNYDNPHRVNKQQVGLGNVPNFAMATDVQHTDASRSDLFTNPRGVLLLVQKYAVNPLNAHIQDISNPHGVTKQQVGLGNVPNFAKATTTQAVDVTNDSTFMTPYLTSLLVQRLSNDPRLDQLIIDFNDHITANNPHHITPALIGTYSSSQIDQLIKNSQSTADAATFGGLDPDQWIAKFPSVADINQILTEITQVYQDAYVAINQLNTDSPITPEQISLEQAQRISDAFGEYNVYTLYNALGDGVIVRDSSIAAGFPTGPIKNLANGWSSSSVGQYYIKSDGTLNAWGTNPVPVPTLYKTAVADPNAKQKLTGVFASKEYVLVYQKNGEIVNLPRTGSAVTLATDLTLQDLFLNNGMVDTRVCAVYRNSANEWKALGDSSWVTAFNTINSQIQSSGRKILDLRIGTEDLVVLTTNNTASANQLKIYKLVFGTSITTTDVTSTTYITNHTSNSTVLANSVTGLTKVAGSFTHHVMTKPISTDSTLCDLYTFGDNSEGQLEITGTSAPFISVGAGYKYTVTINSQNFAEFWGNSPDNSMFWRGGNSIVPT